MASNARSDRSRSPRAGNTSSTPHQEPSEGDDPVVAGAFMQAAAASATAGVKLRHGGPFGACVVKGGIIIACSHNSVLLDKDPTCHAEMNAVRQACQSLQSHDLSDCELYTTCEPCPMCWGAVQWSRLNKVYIGADRFTAAKYGFDDKVFYDEVESHAGSFGLHRCGIPGCNTTGPAKGSSEEHKNMMEVHVGILQKEAEALFTSSHVNKTFRRRLGSGKTLRDMYREAFKQPNVAVSEEQKLVKIPSFPESSPVPQAKVEEFMREAIQIARVAVKLGTSKEREPFGAVVVHKDKVVARATNSVLKGQDATATAEVNAIRAAAAALDTYDLNDCILYSTTVPDVMSMSACLWARIPHVYCGVTQEFALQHGHEEGWLHFQELMSSQPGDRAIQSAQDVAKPICEDVFKFWSSLNGTIY